MPDLFNPIWQRMVFYEGDDGGGGGGDPAGGDAGGGPSGDDGGGGNEFLSMLPEDIREEPTFAKFDSVDALSRSYLNLQRLLGHDKVVIPKDAEDQDAWNELFSRIGRPDNSDGYDIHIEKDAVPLEIREAIDADLMWFKEKAHEMGFTQKQANDFYTSFLKHNIESYQMAGEQAVEQKNQVDSELKAKYGDAYQVKMTLANRAITELGGQELADALTKLGMGRNKHVVEAFIKIGDMMAEDGGIDKTTGAPVDTPEDLQAKVEEIQADPAYLDTEHPKHNLMVNEMTKLMKKLYPETTARTL